MFMVGITIWKLSATNSNTDEREKLTKIVTALSSQVRRDREHRVMYLNAYCRMDAKLRAIALLRHLKQLLIPVYYRKAA